MYRTKSRGYNNTSGTRNRSNLSESSSFSTSSVISAKLWIWNAFKTFFSLLSIHQWRRSLRKVNPINCLLSTKQHSTSCSFLSCPWSASSTANNLSSNSCLSSDGSKSSSINNCNISGCNQVPQPRRRKMTQILSKTMTLLGVAFLIHFIIMSTFAEREEGNYAHGYEGGHHHYIHRSQRSYRNEKHTLPPEENTLSPPKTLNKSEALFFTDNSTIITAQTGSETYLPCAVRNLGSGVASWIRRRDYTLLTVGMGTYSNDARFWVVHNRGAQSWELHIKPIKESDEGVYECQLSAHPPASIFVHLSIVEAKAEILGEPDKHVRSGSTFELVCVLRDSTEPPVYVFWFHNEKMINYDSVRGVVVNSDSEKSILTIQDAKKTDSGNYSCVPSNAKPTSISVHILNGEKPAAMQHGSRNEGVRGPLGSSSSLSLLFVTTTAVFVLTAWLVTTNLNRNLCYLLPPPKQDSIPPPPSQTQDLQLVHIPEPEPHPHPRTIGRKEEECCNLEPVYDLETEDDISADESARVVDKVDMRLGAALGVVEKLRLILSSSSRGYILEISYHPSHTRKVGAGASQKFQDFRPKSTSNKNDAADVVALSRVIVEEERLENRSNIINSASHPSHLIFPSSTRLRTRLGRDGTEISPRDLLHNFSSSLSSVVGIIAEDAVEVETTCTHFLPSSSSSFKSPNLDFDRESLFHCPESELMVGHMALISDR